MKHIGLVMFHVLLHTVWKSVLWICAGHSVISKLSRHSREILLSVRELCLSHRSWLLQKDNNQNNTSKSTRMRRKHWTPLWQVAVSPHLNHMNMYELIWNWKFTVGQWWDWARFIHTSLFQPLDYSTTHFIRFFQSLHTFRTFTASPLLYKWSFFSLYFFLVSQTPTTTPCPLKPTTRGL